MFLKFVGRSVMNLGSVLESRRKDRGISYAELSRRTHINEDMVSRFCKGVSMPKANQFIDLCEELNLDIEDFIPTNSSC